MDICFQSAQECVLGSQEMVQYKFFFWHQAETCLLENLWSLKDFWLVLRLPARRYEIQKNSDYVHWIMWANTKKLYAWNDIVKKRITNLRFWIIYILVQISFFLRTAFRRFSKYFSSIFRRGPTMVADSSTRLPTIKKFPTALTSVIII